MHNHRENRCIDDVARRWSGFARLIFQSRMSGRFARQVVNEQLSGGNLIPPPIGLLEGCFRDFNELTFRSNLYSWSFEKLHTGLGHWRWWLTVSGVWWRKNVTNILLFFFTVRYYRQEKKEKRNFDNNFVRYNLSRNLFLFLFQRNRILLEIT